MKMLAGKVYGFAFESLPEAGQRHEFDIQALLLPLFYTSPHFTDEHIVAFGPLGADASAGISLNRYIGVQQVWNYLFSGNPKFPTQPLDDTIPVDTLTKVGAREKSFLKWHCGLVAPDASVYNLFRVFSAGVPC